MRFIKKLLGPEKSRPGESRFEESRIDESALAEDARAAAASLATRRELLQMLVRDAMRKHGVPSAWVSCFVLLVPPGLHLLLVVRNEPERVFGVASHFQRSFRAELNRFDPQSSEWLHGLSWQFAAFEAPAQAQAAPQGTPAAAQAPVPPPLAAPPAPALQPARDAKAELEREFAARDLQRRSKRRQPQPDFEPTQVGFDPDLLDGPDEFRPTEPAKL